MEGVLPEMIVFRQNTPDVDTFASGAALRAAFATRACLSKQKMQDLMMSMDCSPFVMYVIFTGSTPCKYSERSRYN